MAKPKVVLYLDVHSPFAYLAFYVTKVRIYSSSYDESQFLIYSPVFEACDVTYVPVFLPGIIKACGNKPPMEIKNKDKWLEADRLRWARQFAVPMTTELPAGFPASTAKVQRALCAVTLICPGQLSKTFSALYHTFWGQGMAIHEPEQFHPVLEDALGDKIAREIMAMCTSDEANKILRLNTGNALDHGSFGLPWFVATNARGDTASFWGFDHLGQVVNHLGIQRPGPCYLDTLRWQPML